MKLKMLIGLVALTIVPLTVPALADSIADIYKYDCENCHGGDGKGNGALGMETGAHDFHSDQVKKQTDTQLTEIIKNGKNQMPDFKHELTDDEIRGLVKYIRDLGR